MKESQREHCSCRTLTRLCVANEDITAGLARKQFAEPHTQYICKTESRLIIPSEGHGSSEVEERAVNLLLILECIAKERSGIGEGIYRTQIEHGEDTKSNHIHTKLIPLQCFHWYLQCMFHAVA